MRLKYIALCLSLFCINSFAQNSDDSFQRAREAYELGQFDKVESILGDNIQEMPIENQVQAYRILSLSCMYRDMPSKAEQYASKLLELDPFFSSYGDNPRFTDLLSRLKKGSATITTASKMAESVEEVPVPVTLITSEMIKASGMTRLQDVLMLYVPGISQISGLEDNVAMRGVYGLGQETILVLVDGHRINSSATNSVSFDFRNSLEKVKQIEVLRGPASCLYGNYALTAVVNIITKSGPDLDGGELSAMAGNYNTYGASVLFGNGNLKFDYMAWASLYYSKGQEITMSGTPHYVGGYNTKPTYDIGAKIRWGDLKIEVTGQQSHPVPYYNLISIGEEFTYDKYGTIGGNAPGFSGTMVRADVEWSHSWKNFTLSASTFLSTEKQQIYNVIGDTVNYYVAAALAQALKIPSVKTRGVRQIINWEDIGFGFSATGAYNYKFASMSGSVLAGVQYERMKVGDGLLMIGADYTQTNNVMHGILLEGAEQTVSALLQVKHYFTPRLILNAGLRGDNKRRMNGRWLTTASPRLALVWMPSEVLTLKGGYSHAFVDAPPFYRGSTITLFSGGDSLDPEQMDSFQISANFKWKKTGLSYNVNLFDNIVRDMVYYNAAGSTTGGTTFTNAGRINMCGIEQEFQYNTGRFLASVNCTYQYPLKIENYYNTADDHYMTNVPNALANAVLQYAFVSTAKGDKVYVRANVHAQNGFNCLSNDLVKKMQDPSAITTYSQGAYAVLGCGLEWDSRFGLDVSMDIQNLGNKKYEIGGNLLKGVPGLGRSIILKLDYNF